MAFKRREILINTFAILQIKKFEQNITTPPKKIPHPPGSPSNPIMMPTIAQTMSAMIPMTFMHVAQPFRWFSDSQSGLKEVSAGLSPFLIDAYLQISAYSSSDTSMAVLHS